MQSSIHSKSKDTPLVTTKDSVSMHLRVCTAAACKSLPAPCRTVTLVSADHSALLHTMLSRVLAASCSCYITTQVSIPHASPLSPNPSLYPIRHAVLSITALDLRLRLGILSSCLGQWSGLAFEVSASLLVGELLHIVRRFHPRIIS
jgi:hypothetical protein